MKISDERLRKAILGAPYLNYAEQEIVIAELFVLRAENAERKARWNSVLHDEEESK